MVNQKCVILRLSLLSVSVWIFNVEVIRFYYDMIIKGNKLIFQFVFMVLLFLGIYKYKDLCLFLQ